MERERVGEGRSKKMRSTLQIKEEMKYRRGLLENVDTPTLRKQNEKEK